MHPAFDGAEIVDSDVPLFTDEEIAYQLNPLGGGKGLYWSTQWEDIG